MSDKSKLTVDDLHAVAERLVRASELYASRGNREAAHTLAKAAALALEKAEARMDEAVGHEEQ
jgi:hypothetical protein